jgi:monovalent cation/hydrogen antiporter
LYFKLNGNREKINILLMALALVDVRLILAGLLINQLMIAISLPASSSITN